MAGAADPGGGFLTGWKGICIFLSILGIGAVLGYTGYQGSLNNNPTLVRASVDFVNLESNDFGFNLYDECIVPNVTYPDGSWMFTFSNVPSGSGTTTNTGKIKLSNLEALVKLGGVFEGNTTSPANYRGRPEDACFPICYGSEFKDTPCEFFTYDGLTDDSCRFLAPGQSLPEAQRIEKNFETDPFFLVFDAKCMKAKRDAIIATISRPAPGLKRPILHGAPAPQNRHITALSAAMDFLNGQWFTGSSQTYRPEPGFQNLDSRTCGTAEYNGNFATGDHVVSTMATANEVAVLSLATLWWRDVLAESSAVAGKVVTEILRQAAFLQQVLQGNEILVSIGAEFVSGSTTELLMYGDFGAAQDALMVGDAPTNGQQTTVDPECQFTTASLPAADVAAHTAAALALAANVTTINAGNGTTVDAQDLLDTAEQLLAYSFAKAPLDEAATSGMDEAKALGVSQLYGFEFDDSPNYVRAHQLWASCTLYQMTGDDRFWNYTETIYLQYVNNYDVTPARLTQLYDPHVNYVNPVWWGIMCMAQSAPSYTGFEDDATAAFPDDEDQQTEFLLSQSADGRGFKRGSRGEAEFTLYREFLQKWLTLENSIPTADRRVKSTAFQNFRYFDTNGADPDAIKSSTTALKGMMRDSSGAAMLATMISDLPGNTKDQNTYGRCLAKDITDFILGGSGYSFLVGAPGAPTSTESPLKAYHKDAACPSEEVRKSEFDNIFLSSSTTGQLTFQTRKCDYLTFIGGPRASPNATRGEGPNPIINNPGGAPKGALVAMMDPADTQGVGYLDARMLCNSEPISAVCPEEDLEANPMSQVSIDGNAAIAGALIGMMSHPSNFSGSNAVDCPSIQEYSTQIYPRSSSST